MSHTIVQTDDLDEFDWDTITTTYHDDEVTPAIVVTDFDNGRLQKETFAEDGTLLGTGILYDGGVREAIFYPDAGTIVHVIQDSNVPVPDPTEPPDPDLGYTIFDLGDYLPDPIASDPPDPTPYPGEGGYHPWLQQTWTGNTATGEIVHEVVGNDGTAWRHSFQGNLEGMIVERDDLDSEPWDTRVITFLPDGVTAEQRVTLFDDGDFRLEIFDADENVIENRWVDADQDGSKPWQTITRIYTDNDIFMDARETVYDAGVVRYETFEEIDHVNHRVSLIDTDVTDAFDWDTITTTYHDDGVTPATVVTVFDNGFEITETYREDGSLDHYSEFDATDLDDTFRYYAEYDSDGDLIVEDLSYDDGYHWRKVYVDEVLWFFVEIDGFDGPPGQFEWNSRNIYYLADGSVEDTTTVYDNGTGESAAFDHGTKIIHWALDSDGIWVATPEAIAAGGLHFWLEQTWELDTDTGEITHEIILNDGSVVTSGFSGSLNGIEVDLDSDDLEDWDTIATTFHEDGTTVEAIETLYDDGVIVTEQFNEAGEPVSEISRDLLDANDWDVIETEFFSGGSVASRRETWFDDGVYRDEVYRSNGNLILAIDWDIEDAYDWTLMATRHDESGEVTASQIDYDNGYQFIEYFEGGMLFATTELDGWGTELGEVPGLYDWYTRTNHYGDDGALQAISITLDDGTFDGFFYEDEILVERRIYDSNYLYGEPDEPIPGGLHDWYSQIWTYDSEGNIVSHRIVWDNGDVSVTEYGNNAVTTTTDDTGQVTEIVTVDSDDSKGWHTITERFDENGVMDWQQIVYDDGRISTSVWEDGVPVSVDWQDPEDAKSWETISSLYDENGLLTEKTLVKDDGISTEEHWVDGVRDYTIMLDPDDAAAWKRIDYHYDENGKLAEKLTLRDDGRAKLETWVDGVRASILDTDAEDAASWERIESSYDENGKLAEKYTLLDNGIVEHEFWQDGLRASILQTDAEDAAAWERIETNYDESGRLSDRYTLLDNGIDKLEEWENGVRSQTTETDAEDAASWDRIETVYDDLGRAETKRTTYDDGREKLITWSDGVRVSIVETDGGNAADWDRIDTVYDENGDAAQKVTLYDDGRTKTIIWQDGELVSITETDPLNAVDWVEIETLYDENGDFASRTKTYDNGDLTEVFVPTTTLWDFEGLEAELVTFQTNFGDEKSWAEIEKVEFEGNYFLTRTVYDNGNFRDEFFLTLDDLGEVRFDGYEDEADIFDWDAKATGKFYDLNRKEVYLREDDQDEDLKHFDLDTDVLEFHGQKDGSDQEVWAAQHSHYDEAGDLVRIETHYDDGHYEVEYFSGGTSTGTDMLSEAEYEAAYGDFYAYWELYEPIAFATTV